MNRLLLTLLILVTGLLGSYEALISARAADYQPVVTRTATAEGYAIAWSSLPLPCYYTVEVLACQPDSEEQAVSGWQRIAVFQTWSTLFNTRQTYPFATFWRVSAHSLFQRLGRFSVPLPVEEAARPAVSQPMRPVATAFYPAEHPASATPFLTWTTVPGAVYYELELLGAPPESDGIAPSSHRLFATREVFTNGYNAHLQAIHSDQIYWRVRALDYSGNAIGIFSEASPIHIDRNRHDPLKPLPTTSYQADGKHSLLYPVYSWIPVTDAAKYEVEVTDATPENPNTVNPSVHRIWSNTVTGFDCYDDVARNQPGTYYWRVRALAEDGQAIGVYSDAQPFLVDLSLGSYAATFGDSITHGGGAISYSPADWEYSYQTYLHFPQINLGRSGDTSATMRDRFERDVLPFSPKNLIIMGGTNSLRGGVPADQVITDLTAIRQMCLRYDIRPIFLTLPPINPSAIERAFQEETVPNWRTEFDQVNDFIRQQHYYIELEPFFRDEKGELPAHMAIDGLHMDIEGKRLIGTIINYYWDNVAKQ